MAFDPDAYIANLPKADPGAAFDPDAYIKAKGIKPQVEMAQPTPKKDEPGFFRRALNTVEAGAGAVSNVGHDIISSHGAALLDPSKRHQLERGLGDVLTAGVANKIADWAGNKLGDTGAANLQQTAAADQAAHPEYRATGNVAGMFAPNPFSWLGKETGAFIGGIAPRAIGPVAGATLGAAKGIAGYEAAAVPMAAIQAGTEGMNPIEAARAASKDPLGLLLSVGGGAGAGAAGGKANAIRDPRNFSGRVARSVEAGGGHIQSFGEPVKGGEFSTRPELAGARKGGAGIEDVKGTAFENITKHNEAKRTAEMEHYGSEMNKAAGPVGDANVWLPKATDTLNSFEVRNTSRARGEPQSADVEKFIEDWRHKLSKEVATPNHRPFQSGDALGSQTTEMAPSMNEALSGLNVTGPNPRPETVATRAGVEPAPTPPGADSTTVDQTRLGLARETTPIEPWKVKTIPASNFRDILEFRKQLNHISQTHADPTVKQMAGELAGNLASDLEPYDTSGRVRAANKSYGKTMEDLKRANDIIAGRNKSQLPDRASVERAGAKNIGRVGDENVPGLDRQAQLEELRGMDPAYADQLRLVEMKKAQEALRYGEPATPLSLNRGQMRAAGHGAMKLGLGAMGGKIGHAIAGYPGMVAGGAIGYKAADLLANPVANDLRLKLPVAEYLGNRSPIGLGLGALTMSRADEKQKNADRADAVKAAGKPEPHGAASPTFIDRIEEDKAVLLDDQGKQFVVDVATLPKGAKAGAWIQGDKVVPAPRSSANAIRNRLGAADQGGNFAL